MDYLKIEGDPYVEQIKEALTNNGWADLDVGKVITVHRDGYIVRSAAGEYKSQVLGHLLFEASTEGATLPVTGDWVAFQPFDDQGMIHGVLPRKNLLARETGKHGSETQAIAANLEGGLIVMGADRDFNLNRV